MPSDSLQQRAEAYADGKIGNEPDIRLMSEWTRCRDNYIDVVTAQLEADIAIAKARRIEATARAYANAKARGWTEYGRLKLDVSAEDRTEIETLEDVTEALKEQKS